MKNRMTNKMQISMLIAILVFAAINIPHQLCAQEESDTTSEQGTGTDASDDEQLPDPTDELHKPANTWPKASFVIITPGGSKGSHLGPTGIWGVPMGQNLHVKQVDPKSPADGKVLPEDIIYGANGKGFPADRDARYYFSLAITEAETKEAGGELVLDIRRDGNLIKVPIRLEVMGSFSATTPYNCEKSDRIVARAEDYMRKGLRPEKGLPNNEKYMYAPWNDSVLFLMAAGNPEMQGLVRRYIWNEIQEVEDWKAWVQVRGGGFDSYGGWGTGHLKLLFGEYYHLTGDPTVLPYLDTGALSRGPNPNKPDVQAKPNTAMDWTWPPAQPTGYGTHPHAQMAQVMGDLLAKEAGVKVNEEKLAFDLKYLYVKRAEFAHVGYHGYGAQPLSRRQTDMPEEISEEEKNTGTFSAMNGKPAMAAALFSMVDGHEKAVEMCSRRSMYAYNVTHKGHGGVWFNGFWTPIGASHAGPENFQFFMKGQQWWRELYRNHTGAMWQTGNAREKKDTMGTGFAIHRTIPRKNLRMFGAPRSMFGPTAPAYMKDALAAHRDRNYALAEHIAQKLQVDGLVPEEDMERVNHFIKSVKMVKESIEHDLTFTEGLLTKQNYVLASIELSQLKMVVSPDDPRLKAIAKAVEAKKDQIPTREEIWAQRLKEALSAHSGAKKDSTEEFNKEVASALTLLKDSAEYSAPKGVKKGTSYPKFAKKELSQWRIKTIKQADEAPQGWEQPGFDDSAWKETTLVAGWNTQQIALMRTNFDVKDANAFETLRIHGYARGQENLFVYLNGELVAKGAELPGEMYFDLNPSACKLLKTGRNTLAVSCQRGFGKHPFSLRLNGIRKDHVKNADESPELDDSSPQLPDQSNNARQRNEPKAPAVKESKPMTYREEIAYMLNQLKKVQPKMLIGDKEFPSTEVHEYLSSFYDKHQSKITSKDVFLDKVAFKTQGGLVYYVVDAKGNKTMLKDWFEETLARGK